MIRKHSRIKFKGQSVQKIRLGTNGRTDGQDRLIALAFLLTRLVMNLFIHRIMAAKEQ